MHTHSRAKYLGNLFLFALIAEIPFDLAIKRQVLEFSSQNVMFTLAIGLATIWALEYLSSSQISKGLQTLLTLLAAIAGALTALLLHSDYSFFGVLVIVIMYMFRTRPFMCGMVGCITLTMMSYGEFTSFLCLIPLRKYNGTRGLNIKYAFYAFYPVHLLILWGIAGLIL